MLVSVLNMEQDRQTNRSGGRMNRYKQESRHNFQNAIIFKGIRICDKLRYKNIFSFNPARHAICVPEFLNARACSCMHVL